MKYSVPHYRAKLVVNATAQYVKEEIPSSYDAKNLAIDLLNDNDREEMIAIHLDGANKITCSETIALGTSNSAASTPREIFRGAIVSGAVAIIIAHCHPSGLSTPSQDDIAFTRKLVQVGNILGITVLDHIVVGCRKNTATSMYNLNSDLFGY